MAQTNGIMLFELFKRAPAHKQTARRRRLAIDRGHLGLPLLTAGKRIYGVAFGRRALGEAVG
jgi:hypothetical protein